MDCFASLARTKLAHAVRQVGTTGKSLLIFRNRVKPGNQKYSASKSCGSGVAVLALSWREVSRR
jgi:hypothetical protein